MQITDLLAQVGGLESMARELNVPESQVAGGAEALLPAILGGFKKQAQAQPAGLDGLGGLLGQLGGGEITHFWVGLGIAAQICGFDCFAFDALVESEIGYEFL